MDSAAPNMTAHLGHLSLRDQQDLQKTHHNAEYSEMVKQSIKAETKKVAPGASGRAIQRFKKEKQKGRGRDTERAP